METNSLMSLTAALILSLSACGSSTSDRAVSGVRSVRNDLIVQ